MEDHKIKSVGIGGVTTVPKTPALLRRLDANGGDLLPIVSDPD